LPLVNPPEKRSVFSVYHICSQRRKKFIEILKMSPFVTCCHFGHCDNVIVKRKRERQKPMLRICLSLFAFNIPQRRRCEDEVSNEDLLLDETVDKSKNDSA